jgi:sporulation protein YabP
MIESRKMEKSQLTKRSQNLMLENREKLTVTGVINVDSFNEEHVILETDLGVLEIRGEELHITKLNLDNNSGEVSVDGNVYALEYFDEDNHQKSSGLFSRLFK